MITISEVTNDADLEPLRGAWDALLRKVPDEIPFLSFEWTFSYRRHLGQGKLFVLVAKQNERICCIAPLCLTQRYCLGVPVRVASFITTQQTNTDRLNFINKLFGIDNRLGWSDQANFLFDPDHPEALHETIRYLKRSDRWDVLDLREFPPESLALSILEEEFQGAPYRIERPESSFSKRILMRDGYKNFKNDLKRKNKKNINYSANRLVKLGGVVTRHFQDPYQIALMFPILVKLEKESRKGAEETGSLVRTENRRFHEEFAMEWALKGRSHLFVLEREQEILSYALLFQGKEVVYMHSTAINPEYMNYSPGFNLAIESMKILSAQEFEVFNFGRGDGAIINSLKNDQNPRPWIKIFKNGTSSGLLHYFEFVLRPKMKALMSSESKTTPPLLEQNKNGKRDLARFSFFEVSDDADLESLRDDWNALLKKVPDENPFLSFEWVSSYRKHLGKGKLFVLVAKKNKKVCCIAPLRITQRYYFGMRIRIVSFITTEQTNTDYLNALNKFLGIDNRLGWSDQADFLFDPDHPEALHETIRYLKQSDQWDVLDLREFPPESPAFGILEEEFQGAPYHLEKPESALSKYVLMPQGFENFKKGLKRKTKKSINHSANRLEKLGGVTTQYYQDPGKIAQMFPVLAELEQKGRKGAEETGCLVNAENRGLHEESAKGWVEKGRFHLFTLEREQEILSYVFLFQGRKFSICTQRLSIRSTRIIHRASRSSLRA